MGGVGQRSPTLNPFKNNQAEMEHKTERHPLRYDWIYFRDPFFGFKINMEILFWENKARKAEHFVWLKKKGGLIFRLKKNNIHLGNVSLGSPWSWWLHTVAVCVALDVWEGKLHKRLPCGRWHYSKPSFSSFVSIWSALKFVSKLLSCLVLYSCISISLFSIPNFIKNNSNV